MIKNIIFDWSGVVCDNIVSVHCAVMAIFEKYGVPKMSLEQFREEWEQPYMVFYNRYIPEIKRKKEEKYYRKVHKEAVLKYPSKPFLGIQKILQKFKKTRIKMIIISSDPEETLLSEIGRFGLRGIFSEINSEVHDKAEDIRETIQRNNFNPKETIFIGDTAHEVEAGRSAGTKTGAVTWGYNNEDKLRAANPDFVIHNLEELEEIILK